MCVTTWWVSEAHEQRDSSGRWGDNRWRSKYSGGGGASTTW
jgi:hypothetical protein